MSQISKLVLAGMQHAQLKRHLLIDGREAAAILLCKRVENHDCKYLCKNIVHVPHARCAREVDFLHWPGEYLELAIDQAESEGLSLFLAHSHPNGPLAFSEADDLSDQIVMPCLYQAIETIHGSTIMESSGAMIARTYDATMACRLVDLVTVAGDDLFYWWGHDLHPNSLLARPLTFTSHMTAELGRLSAAVIGASGIGSVVIEQLARLGFGRVILIDFDKVEEKNLNRILNTATTDARAERLKVDVLAEAIRRYRQFDSVQAVSAPLASREAVFAAAACDVLFCCVDTLEARQLCDSISSRFLIPLFDAGVCIPTRKTDPAIAIGDVCGRIDYVQPGGSTLADRGVYTPEGLRAEYLREAAPDAYADELQAGYIKGMVEEAPAVISLNMIAAARSVNEFLARAYPFRLEPNQNYARLEFSLAACEEEYYSEGLFSRSENLELALGDLEPLLGLPSLGKSNK